MIGTPLMSVARPVLTCFRSSPSLLFTTYSAIPSMSEWHPMVVVSQATIPSVRLTRHSKYCSMLDWALIPMFLVILDSVPESRTPARPYMSLVQVRLRVPSTQSKTLLDWTRAKAIDSMLTDMFPKLLFRSSPMPILLWMRSRRYVPPKSATRMSLRTSMLRCSEIFWRFALLFSGIFSSSSWVTGSTRPRYVD